MLAKFVKGFIAILVFSITAVASYIYLSVDNRVSPDKRRIPFSNSSDVVRLDSLILSPDSIKQFVSSLMKSANVQGLGFSIINNNGLVFQDYFGSRNVQKGELFSPGVIWYAASLSKPLFADIVLQLAEDKLLNLDMPLYKYLKKPLPEYRTNLLDHLLGSQNIDYTDLKQDDRYKRITARMCLSHTTGLPNWRWLETDGKLKIKFEPGSRYAYSGEGMFLLQFVIEELLGKDLEEIAWERVLVPYSMPSSSFVWQRGYESNYVVGHDGSSGDLRIPKFNTSNGAGSLSTTLEEYTAFFQRILKQDIQRYNDLVTPQIRIFSRQQFGPNADVMTSENDSIKLSYGLGFGLYESQYGRAFFKEGHLEGWQHYVVGFPDRGFGLVLMSNSDQAEGIFKELIEYLTGNKNTPWYWEGYMPYEHKH